VDVIVAGEIESELGAVCELCPLACPEESKHSIIHESAWFEHTINYIQLFTNAHHSAII